MEIEIIDEPEMLFGKGRKEICPRAGIRKFYPYDIDEEDRPEKIILGLIGIKDSLNIIEKWVLERQEVVLPKETHLTNLYPEFCGVNEDVGFCTKMGIPNGYKRELLKLEIYDILAEGHQSKRVELLVDLYIKEVAYLAKNKKPSVIICIISETFMESILQMATDGEDDSKKRVDDEEVKLEYNFRRMLKAKAMKYNIPIQILRDRIEKPSSDMQEEATIAWNFFTALYYKAGGIPWALNLKDDSGSCFAGISFYRSRDNQTIQISVAQIFNERGKGVILRGEPVEISKDDRIPHLTKKQAYDLLITALTEYHSAVRTPPVRMVLHKSSNFSDDEIAGFNKAAKEFRIFKVDMLTIQSAGNLRLYREGDYPPIRGTVLSLDEENHLLYTRGAVPYYRTYTGKYIPSPILVRLFQYDESPIELCKEILALTKMNWNNTQFDRKLPITIECSRKVGEILKYLEADEAPQLKYSFYM